jgi:hypothetical protein
VTDGARATTTGYVLVRGTFGGAEVYSALAQAGGTVTIPRSALREDGSYTVSARFLGTATLNPSSGAATLTAR